MIPSGAANTDTTKAMAEDSFNIVTATAGTLGRLLDAGKVSSVELVERYRKQIDKNNMRGLGLRAVLAVRSLNSLIQEAKDLDEERASKGPTSRLHGIPILIVVPPACLPIHPPDTALAVR